MRFVNIGADWWGHQPRTEMVNVKNKDKSIVDICNVISKNMESVNFTSVGHWDADLCAIGLKTSDKLIYLSTWNIEGDIVDLKCFVQFEIIDPNSEKTLKIVDTFSTITIKDLLPKIQSFLQS